MVHVALGVFQNFQTHGSLSCYNIRIIKRVDELFIIFFSILHGQLIGIIEGITDDANKLAMEDAEKNNKQFIHPFDDPDIIAGQGTVGLEILEDTPGPIDYLFLPIGGGGLASGLGSVFKTKSPETRIIGLEPEGAPAMFESLRRGYLVNLDKIDPRSE